MRLNLSEFDMRLQSSQIQLFQEVWYHSGENDVGHPSLNRACEMLFMSRESPMEYTCRSGVTIQGVDVPRRYILELGFLASMSMSLSLNLAARHP
jgi:hypothetical protein